MKARFLLVCMGLLVVTAVGAGIYTIGGPQAARLERQDLDLLRDLRRMAGRLRCDKPAAVLPQKLDEEALQGFCDGEIQTWPGIERKRADVDVTYHRKSDTTFMLCAAFHDPNVQAIHASYNRGFDPKTGCWHGSID